MDYYKNILELIEKDIVLRKKHRLIESYSTLETYFNIGKNIVEAQGGEKRAKYGNNLIKEWSKCLTEKYGKGYDVSNLKRMRQFYMIFGKGGTLCHQLSWSHYRYVLTINEESKRNYYINICVKQNLSVRQLREKIKNKEYERLKFKDNIELFTDKKQITIKDMIKNPIIIPIDKDIDKLSEKALKQFILEKIELFLLELGYGFCYIGNEIRLGHHKCDLLFFNYELNRFFVIELKIRKLLPQDIGQIKLYMCYIDQNMRKEYMAQTVGMILCKENDEIVLGYMSDENIFSSTYQLITK